MNISLENVYLVSHALNLFINKYILQNFRVGSLYVYIKMQKMIQDLSEMSFFFMLITCLRKGLQVNTYFPDLSDCSLFSFFI